MSLFLIYTPCVKNCLGFRILETELHDYSMVIKFHDIIVRSSYSLQVFKFMNF